MARPQWTYLVKTRHYWKLADSGIEACAYPFAEWTHLSERLRSPVATEHESLKILGRNIKCTIARGELPAQDSRPAGRRALWIDGLNHTIWMYRIETPSTNLVETYKFQWQVYGGLSRSADVWQLDSGAGAAEISAAAGPVELDQPAAEGQPAGSAAEPPREVYRIGGRVLPPRLIHKVEPQYPRMPQQLRVEGMVVLEGEVRADGRVQNLRLVKSLEAELDQQAIVAVSQWRFQLGTRDGTPVAVLSTFEVNFKLR